MMEWAITLGILGVVIVVIVVRELNTDKNRKWDNDGKRWEEREVYSEKKVSGPDTFHREYPLTEKDCFPGAPVEEKFEASAQKRYVQINLRISDYNRALSWLVENVGHGKKLSCSYSNEEMMLMHYWVITEAGVLKGYQREPDFDEGDTVHYYPINKRNMPALEEAVKIVLA